MIYRFHDLAFNMYELWNLKFSQTSDNERLRTSKVIALGFFQLTFQLTLESRLNGH